MEKIRIHTGRIQNKYGVDVASLIDDPVDPMYNMDEVKEQLMKSLDYTPNEDDDSEYPGLYDGEVGSYFDYDGYIDVNIPQSIVDRIRAEK